jgi:hypothetical protein
VAAAAAAAAGTKVGVQEEALGFITQKNPGAEGRGEGEGSVTIQANMVPQRVFCKSGANFFSTQLI